MARTLPLWFHWILATFIRVSMITGSTQAHKHPRKTNEEKTAFCAYDLMSEARWWEHHTRGCFSANSINSIIHGSGTTGELTFVVLVAHDLAASVVVADGEAGAVWLDVTLGSGVPVDPCDADSSGQVRQAMQGHLHLNTMQSKRNAVVEEQRNTSGRAVIGK